MFEDSAPRTARRPHLGRPVLIAAIVVGILALLIVGFLVFGQGHGEQKGGEATHETSSQTVTVATATTQALSRIVTASGTVSAWEEVPVGAETGGLTATAVLTDEGRYVQQGQVLVQLNDTLLRAQLRQQSAAVASAEATVAQADAALARAQELRERGFLSQAGLDNAIAQQATAQAQLQAASAGRAETQARVNQAAIRAPVSGLVISRSVTRGQIVQPGTELFRIVRDGRLELDARIPETEVALIRAGQSARVLSDGIGQTSGSVRIITPEVDPQTRLAVARISIASGSGLRPGMFARAEIDAGHQPSIVVPTASIIYRENRSGVFLLADGGVARFQEVTVLSRDNEQSSVDGVAAGSQVIVEGAGFLGDGDRVTVAPSQ